MCNYFSDARLQFAFKGFFQLLIWTESDDVKNDNNKKKGKSTQLLFIPLFFACLFIPFEQSLHG